jgi:predicted CopG family antitoxin
MSPSERRKRLRLKRIVVSEHNYLALKRLGQAGDSFNDVISNLLRIERNHQQDKEEKEKKQEQLLQLQEKSSDEDNSISDVVSEPFPPDFIEEVMEKHDRQLDELARLYKEERKKQEQKEQQSSNSNRTRNQ